MLKLVQWGPSVLLNFPMRAVVTDKKKVSACNRFHFCSACVKVLVPLFISQHSHFHMSWLHILHTVMLQKNDNIKLLKTCLRALTYWDTGMHVATSKAKKAASLIRKKVENCTWKSNIVLSVCEENLFYINFVFLRSEKVG